ncbi:hypothetical protein Tco_1284275 [Tanacetum coccineum]
MTRTDSLEKDLKQTKLTMGSAIVKLVKKVKKVEGILKRRNVVLSDSKEEEPKAQGRKRQDDPLVSLVQGLVTPSKTIVNASGEEQVKDINPTTLEAAKTLSRVASQKPKSIDKGRRYKRRKETKGKKVVTSLDFQEEVSTVSGKVSTDSIKKSIPSPDKGQREGKGPMIIEEAPKKTKEQILQEEAKLSKSVLGSGLQGEDFAKKMVRNTLQRKDDEAKDDESTKKTGKRRKQIARKGLHSDKTDEDESEASKDADPISGTNIPINPVPVAIKPPSIATYKIIKQGKEGVYQIVREDGTDIVYINFGAMLKDITRDDLTELYRIVMNRYGMNGPEDELEKVLWEYLKNMFEAPLSTDPIWSSLDIYMLTERKYPLTAKVCKAMLDKKLQGGKPDEDCYKLLKWMEKQAGIRKHKDWLVQEQTTLGKDFSNPLMADNLRKIWMVHQLTKFHVQRVDMVIDPLWNLPFLGAKGLTSPEQMATGVNTLGSDENSLKLYDLIADMKGC